MHFPLVRCCERKDVTHTASPRQNTTEPPRRTGEFAEPCLQPRRWRYRQQDGIYCSTTTARRQDICRTCHEAPPMLALTTSHASSRCSTRSVQAPLFVRLFISYPCCYAEQCLLNRALGKLREAISESATDAPIKTHIPTRLSHLPFFQHFNEAPLCEVAAVNRSFKIGEHFGRNGLCRGCRLRVGSCWRR
jgi:hypothetical protein